MSVELTDKLLMSIAGWEVMKPWLKKYSGLVRFVSADEVRQDYFTSESVPADFSKEPFLTGKRE